MITENGNAPRSVLMTAMAMDIGGAETHIAELTKALLSRGVSVTIASAGGAYAQELVRCGARHVCLPLGSKNPRDLIRSYRGLKQLIAHNDFDLIHAHARIPAVISGMLARRSGVRFLTTVHGAFRVNALWRRLTDWGEHAVAVSYDLKDYLVREYGFPPEQISVTVNGIDTDRFAPVGAEERAELCRNLGLDPALRRVLCVSRIAPDALAMPMTLSAIAARIGAAFPDTEIVIVGGGSSFAELEKTAEEQNRIAGRQVVRLVGASTAVRDYTAVSDIFCGISRAALEAMAASLPVILGGDGGYIGIYGPERKQIAYATNFCCRGCDPMTEEKLLSDLGTLLRAEREELHRMGDYDRRTVTDDYSVSRMADDYLNAYRTLYPYRKADSPRVMLVGYYGFHNAGDDALLRAVCEDMRTILPDARLTALTAHARRSQKEFGIPCIGRYRLLRIAKEMRSTDIFMLGGGSLLQDVTSARSLRYYLTVLRMAQKRGCRTVLYGGGIGPILREKGKRQVKEALLRTDLVTVRDPQSLRDAQAMGVEAILGADPVFRGFTVDPDRTADLLHRFGLEKDGYFVLSVRAWSKTDAAFSASLAAAARQIAADEGLIPVVVPMYPKEDTAVCRTLAKDCGGKLLCDLSRAELIGILSFARWGAGMRLHFLISAALASLPFLALSYDSKVEALASVFAMPCIDVSASPRDEIAVAMQSLSSRNAALREQVRAETQRQTELARRNADAVLRLVTDAREEDTDPR